MKRLHAFILRCLAGAIRRASYNCDRWQKRLAFWRMILAFLATDLERKADTLEPPPEGIA